jgi:hypothetical protein
MTNSFTFKKPKAVSCFHDERNGGTAITVSYIGWHWMYEPENKQLGIYFNVGPTKWLEALAEKHFVINVQSPTYWNDHKRTVKGKPAYEKAMVDWNKDLDLNIIDIKFSKDNYYGYLAFKQKVSNLHGDSIMGLYQSMRGFWQEFRTVLKQSKTCDPVELNTLLTSMNCRLITYNTNSMTHQTINSSKKSFKYDQTVEVIDAPIDLPW